MNRFLALPCSLLLGACASGPTIPFSLTETSGTHSSPSAFLWTSGWSRLTPAYDYATVTSVDGTDVPEEFLPRPKHAPIDRGLLEISPGIHQIEILYKEEPSTRSAFCLGTCAFANEKLRKVLEITVQPEKIYVPFVSDLYGCDWFWVEDWGEYEPGMETRQSGGLKTKLNRPVVGGTSPSESDCTLDEG